MLGLVKHVVHGVQIQEKVRHVLQLPVVLNLAPDISQMPLGGVIFGCGLCLPANWGSINLIEVD